MRYSKWHRDEIILALDLYFDKERDPVDARNPKIIKLSKILNCLPIFEVRNDLEKFRNPNGVSLKLSNFLAIDPSYQGKGMEKGPKLDKVVFDEFYTNQRKLHELANEIKAIAKNPLLISKVAQIEDDESSELDSVIEGQVLYKLHKVRERDKTIIAEKKKSVLKAKGKLECEACGFNFENKYGAIGKGFIECHLIVPLSKFDSLKETKLKDLVLVCSNCHRMLHKDIAVLGIEEFKLKVIKSN